MAASFTFDSKVRLNSGHEIPLLGFGVAFGYGKDEDVAAITKPSLLEALKIGYRHIDTAEMYHNEKEVGDALRESGVKREDLFLTSKVPDYEAGYDKTTKCLDKSLRLLQTDYLDLYLIHKAPVGTAARLDTWRALVDAKKAGKVRSIGVSNYNIRHIEEIKAAGMELPSVNQLEIHPFCQQKPIVDYCNANGILLQAYCCIIRGAMDHPVIQDIAKKHKKDTAQVLLRWSLQRGFNPLVRSSNPARIKSNAELDDFVLDEEDMKRLNDLDRGAAGSINWNPIDVE